MIANLQDQQPVFMTHLYIGITVVWLMLCPVLQVLAQTTLKYYNPLVIKNGSTLSHPFAGGINSAQYQTIDMDGDTDLDLLVFDRASDKVNCFENTGSQYQYQPAFEYLFPEGLLHWLVLADYDCDGRKDLFTYTGQGIRVFKNTLSGGLLQWELVVDPIRTQGTSSLINLFFNPTDIPSITDLDGDGDLDILVFDFSSSEQIEFHKNNSIENTGVCGLTFQRETRTFGDIIDCGCDDFLVGQPCGSGGRVLHAGGKAILSMDYNGDGQQDIVLGQELCTNLSLALHTGTDPAVSFSQFDNNFPQLDRPLDFVTFPAAFLEDVTFDGKKDLLISSNVRSNQLRDINFRSSSLLFANTSPGVFVSPVTFLQDQMIDVGEYAYPTLADINGDAQSDLVIGHAGNPVEGSYVSGLVYYKSEGDRLIWQTDDLFGLSTYGFSHIKPQFVDLTGDGRVDLVFSAWDASLVAGLYFIVNQGSAALSFDPNQLQTIDFNFSALDDYTFTDINEDGLHDLLIGLSSGGLNYYQNIGTAINPSFELQAESYLGIVGDGDHTFLSLTTGDLDGDDRIDLVTTDRSGQVRIYADFIGGNPVADESILQLQENTQNVSTRLGRQSRPAVGKIHGRTTIALGSIQGGIQLLSEGIAEVTGEALTFTAYPVPSTSDGEIQFQANLSDTQVEIFSLTGTKLMTISLSSNVRQTILPNQLRPGLYLAKATHGEQVVTLKFVVSHI